MIDWAVELDPWGNVLNEFNPMGIDQPIRMQGQQVDRESGLFYNRYRYYDPQMGRYITQDPIGLAGGQHLYTYVESTPLTSIDPLGLDETIYSPGKGRSFADGPRNGNWCGGKWSGGVIGGVGTAPPVDSMDAVCKAHDNCYDNGTPKLTCDASMVKAMKALPADPTKWEKPPPKGTEFSSDGYRKANILIFSK
jgi:RHS repeat-associated protein